MDKNLDNKRFLLEDENENRWLFFLSSSKRQYYKLGRKINFKIIQLTLNQ